MLSVDEFRDALRRGELDHLIDDVLLGKEAVHVPPLDIEFLRKTLLDTYRAGEAEVVIVGSAKLGFSTCEKILKGAPPLPRYRPFGAHSDIDAAIVSPDIFSLIWHELSAHSHRETWFPWKSRALGDYLVCGWLRPDHFPHGARLRQCDIWWDLFRRLSSNRRFGLKKVRGGLFYDHEHLRRYQARSILECERAERLTA